MNDYDRLRSINAGLRKQLRTQARTIKTLRKLLARAYKAATKPEWEEGECWNEVSSDVRWEGIDVPEMERRQHD